MEIILFVVFSLVATAAVLASPVKRTNYGKSSIYCDERGEIILLDDLHRTTFRKD
jgi:hypothetical protein